MKCVRDNQGHLAIADDARALAGVVHVRIEPDSAAGRNVFRRPFIEPADGIGRSSSPAFAPPRGWCVGISTMAACLAVRQPDY
jgi:hypothetical protein